MKKINLPKPVGFLLLVVILFALGYLLPWTFVLGKAGLLEPEVYRQLTIYNGIIFFAIGVILIYLFNLFYKGDDRYGNNIGVYNKDETKIGRRFTYGQLTLLSLIILPTIFLISNVLNFLKKGAFGLQVIPQQFSKTDSLIVNTFQIPIAENFMAIFTLGIIIIGINLLAKKYNWSKDSTIIYKYALGILGLAVFGFIWHQSVYSGNVNASFIVAIFWGLGALLSLGTGFFIPFLVMHMSNNFFIDFSRLYSNSALLGLMIFFIVAMAGLYFYLYKDRLWGKK